MMTLPQALPFTELRLAMNTPSAHPVDLARLVAALRKPPKVGGDLAFALAKVVIGATVGADAVREIGWDLALLQPAATARASSLVGALIACPDDAAALRAGLASTRDLVSMVVGAEVPFAALVDATILQAVRESARHGLDLGDKNKVPATELARRVCLAVAVPIAGESFADARAALLAIDGEALAWEALRKKIEAGLEKSLKKDGSKAP